MQYYINSSPMSPLSRLLAVVMTVVALAAALFFGLIVLALAFGIGLVFWLSFRLRLWWMRHHSPENDAPLSDSELKRKVIDAEYTVVSRRKD